ncbi:M20/M25/M40 family metallo-hydrolase [Lachnotalea glycerini]|uniref:M20/M25/M40 family metallo-hydrolase n=1 Tax=Lachnotalea glycerini TaxID=1763509 RepID=A0A371JCU9_9FIRM|nr:M20/M25/M40 family metallo-hydrolase [Lachnotalea glycerini]RDY30507.1 M20/M25/M40 family metallo-hydrolase [Lachnotalea glycerini]
MINKKALMEEFCSLAAIDALSFQEREIADVLKEKLIALGFTVIEDHAGVRYNGNCGNLYAFLQGEIGSEPLLFSAHMDTVGPGTNKRAVFHKNGMITSDGTTVLGADDLCGIVCILEAIRSLKEDGVPHHSIEVLFTIAEEMYIRGSEVFDYSLVKAKEAYVLDLSGQVGTAAIAAPTLFSFSAVFIGKASHAGFAPEQGKNAIMAAAKAITEISQGRLDEETTANVGMIEGGQARNIVPDLCTLKGEVRSLSHEKAIKAIDNIKQKIEKVCKEQGIKFSFNYEVGCLSYRTQITHPVVQRFERSCQFLGYKTRYIDTFGGSDNNNFMKNGITGIVIAAGMNQVHSCDEYTNINELEKAARIVAALMTLDEKGENSYGV